MLAVKITALIVGLIALILTFKASFVIEKVLKKEPTERLVLRVKYFALILAVIAFLAVFISGR
ncbi:MAG: hypothetical protein IJX57_02345 [Clostridia bacterium]|nr:hypothetical protein [Clostridia bacterium]